jgi:histidinol phosphatase-like PHP family hydrolase
MRYGVAVARRAWLTPSDVLNTRPVSALASWLKQRRTKQR